MSVSIVDVSPRHLPAIEELEKRCFSLPWTWDMLMSQLPDEVREHNEPAIALYRKHGFSPVGLRKNYYEAPVENALLMTKYLK